MTFVIKTMMFIHNDQSPPVQMILPIFSLKDFAYVPNEDSPEMPDMPDEDFDCVKDIIID